LNMT